MFGYVILAALGGFGCFCSYHQIKKQISESSEQPFKMKYVLQDVLHIYEETNEWKRISDDVFCWMNGDYAYYIFKENGQEDIFVDVYHESKFVISMKTDEHYKIKVLSNAKQQNLDANTWIMENIFQFRGWAIHMKYRFMKEDEKQKFLIYPIKQPKRDEESQKELLARLQIAMYQCSLNPYITRENKREITIDYSDFSFKVMITPTNHTLVLCLHRGKKLFHYGFTDGKVNYTKESSAFLHAIEKNTNLAINLCEWTVKMKEHCMEATEIVDSKEIALEVREEKEIHPIFKEEFEKMDALRQHVSYITPEEFHLITTTYPKDLHELTFMFHTLDEEDKNELQPKIKQTKQQVQEKLAYIEKELSIRKRLEVEQKIRVINTRE